MDDVPVGVVFVGICIGDKSWTLKMTTQTQEREKIIMEAVAFGVVNLIKKLK
jgi:nicotinamide mononucleotide (NMN) deamidase PncC